MEELMKRRGEDEDRVASGTWSSCSHSSLALTIPTKATPNTMAPKYLTGDKSAIEEFLERFDVCPVCPQFVRQLTH